MLHSTTGTAMFLIPKACRQLRAFHLRFNVPLAQPRISAINSMSFLSKHRRYYLYAGGTAFRLAAVLACARTLVSTTSSHLEAGFLYRHNSDIFSIMILFRLSFLSMCPPSFPLLTHSAGSHLSHFDKMSVQ